MASAEPPLAAGIAPDAMPDRAPERTPPAAPGTGPAGTLGVEVVCSPEPGRLLRCPVRLPPGATAADALRASGIAGLLPAGLLDQLTLGLWGRACQPSALLHEGDRVELTRPLTVDPKEARRLRYRRDGLRRPVRPRRGPASGA